MPRIYTATGSVSDPYIEVSEDMETEFQTGYVYTEFSNNPFPVDYNDPSPTLVIPSAGTVTHKPSPNGVNFLTFNGGSDIDVSVEDYTAPQFLGLAVAGRSYPTGITGALFFRTIWARW